MTIDYVQKSYYWLPRINENALSGTYAAVPAGGAYYTTDLRRLLPSGHGQGNFWYNWVLPPNFPQKCLIVRAMIAIPASDNIQVNAELYVDVGGQFYKTGTPPGAEVGSTFYNCIPVLDLSERTSGPIRKDTGVMSYPIPFDRSVDNLELSVSNNTELNWISCRFIYLVPAPFQPS